MCSYCCDYWCDSKWSCAFLFSLSFCVCVCECSALILYLSGDFCSIFYFHFFSFLLCFALFRSFSHLSNRRCLFSLPSPFSFLIFRSLFISELFHFFFSHSLSVCVSIYWCERVINCEWIYLSKSMRLFSTILSLSLCFIFCSVLLSARIRTRIVFFHSNVCFDSLFNSFTLVLLLSRERCEKVEHFIVVPSHLLVACYWIWTSAPNSIAISLLLIFNQHILCLEKSHTHIHSPEQKLIWINQIEYTKRRRKANQKNTNVTTMEC